MNPETRTYDKHWMPWVKNTLVASGIPTEIPHMPDPWAPSYEAYKAEFEKQTIHEDTILVGHSCGSTFLLRWLGDSKKHVAKLIMVAPWALPSKDNEIQRDFYEHTIDPSIKDRVKEIVYFTADDEDPDGKESLRMIHTVLGGTILNLPNHGHYVLADMGTEEFPELMEQITS